MSLRRPVRAYIGLLIRRGATILLGAVGAVNRVTNPRRSQHAGIVNRILVIRLDLIGDIVFTMPAVAALSRAYPTAHITMLTLPYTEPLARLFSDVDDVIAVDTNRIRTVSGLVDPATWRNYGQVIRHIRRCRFDLAISVSGQMASLCAFLSGASLTVGYEGEAYRNLLTHPVSGKRYDERKHEIEYGLALARAVGATGHPELPRPLVTPTAQAVVETALAALPILSTKPLVVVHPGAGHGSAKRWPPDRWASFIERVQAVTGAQFILVGGASDLNLAADVQSRTAVRTASLVGQTSLEELVALLAMVDLVASGDSGPLHLAVALGTPVVAVFGPTDPRIYGPHGNRGYYAVHRFDLPCSPCYAMTASAECPLGDPICMRLTTVNRMVESAVAALTCAKHEFLVSEQDTLQDAKRGERCDQ